MHTRTPNLTSWNVLFEVVSDSPFQKQDTQARQLLQQRLPLWMQVRTGLTYPLEEKLRTNWHAHRALNASDFTMTKLLAMRGGPALLGVWLLLGRVCCAGFQCSCQGARGPSTR